MNDSKYERVEHPIKMLFGFQFSYFLTSESHSTNSLLSERKQKSFTWVICHIYSVCLFFFISCSPPQCTVVYFCLARPTNSNAWKQYYIWIERNAKRYQIAQCMRSLVVLCRCGITMYTIVLSNIDFVRYCSAIYQLIAWFEVKL